MSVKGRVKWTDRQLPSVFGQMPVRPFDERSEPEKLRFSGLCPERAEIMVSCSKWGRVKWTDRQQPSVLGQMPVRPFDERREHARKAKEPKRRKQIRGSDRIMPENKSLAADHENRRMQRLKKCIILVLMLAIAIPVVLCIVLLIRISGLNKTVDVLSSQLDDLAWTVAEQRQELEELTAEFHVHRKAGPVVTNRSGNWQGQADYDGTALSEPEQPSDMEQLSDSEQPLHRVYLTFDDGPSIYTDDILEILDRYGVKATFFVVGKESDSDKEALTMIVDGGHTLGMHSYTHKYAELYQSVEAFAEDFVKLQSYLYEVTGVESTIYRFPGGSSNRVSNIDMEEFASYLESQGVQFYDWNISSGDAASTQLSIEAVVRNSMAGLRENSTSIILFHDSADKRSTVDALPIIIERIQAMEDTVILPITEETEPIQHIHR